MAASHLQHLDGIDRALLGAALPKGVLVQSKISLVDNTPSLAFNSNNAAGNCLVVAVHYGAAPGNISDSRGNVYTLVGNDVQAAGGVNTKCWVATNCAAGANTVTLSNKAAIWILLEYSGVSAASVMDTSNTVQGAATVSLSVTTTVASDLLIMVAATVGNTSAPGQTGAYTFRQGGGGNYGGTNHAMSVFDTVSGPPGTYSNTANAMNSQSVGFLVAQKT